MNATNLVEDLTLLPLPSWWQSPWIIVGLLLALALIGLAVWQGLRQWRRRPQPEPGPAPGPDRLPEFLERLEALRRRRGELSAYELAVPCSDVLREYLEWRHRLAIRYQTTREFLAAASQHPALGAPLRESLGTYLAFCDRVKFARQAATPEEEVHLLDAAEVMIRQDSASR